MLTTFLGVSFFFASPCAGAGGSLWWAVWKQRWPKATGPAGDRLRAKSCSRTDSVRDSALCAPSRVHARLPVCQKDTVWRVQLECLTNICNLTLQQLTSQSRCRAIVAHTATPTLSQRQLMSSRMSAVMALAQPQHGSVLLRRTHLLGRFKLWSKTKRLGLKQGAWPE